MPENTWIFKSVLPANLNEMVIYESRRLNFWPWSKLTLFPIDSPSHFLSTPLFFLNMRPIWKYEYKFYSKAYSKKAYPTNADPPYPFLSPCQESMFSFCACVRASLCPSVCLCTEQKSIFLECTFPLVFFLIYKILRNNLHALSLSLSLSHRSLISPGQELKNVRGNKRL